MPRLSVERIDKSFGAVPALRGFDLDVADGELLAVVGPSGCGKTTALRAVAGLERVDAGKIRIGDRDVTGIDAADRNIAMVFQNHALFPHLTVEENIGFGMRARRVPAAEIRRAAGQAAEVVGCTDLLSRRPHEISGGERQRVALARGLVRRPDVFLLDEPLSNLDAHLRLEMRRELRRIHTEVGGTMVHVTHDQVEALTLGDRVAVVAAGSVQQVGTPDEVYRSPVNRFVATFIGSPAMNLLPAVVEGDRLRAGPIAVPVPTRTGRAASPAPGVEIGIRPEHLHIGGGRGDITFQGAVVAVESAGADAYAQLDVSGLRLTARTPSEGHPVVGETVPVSADTARVLVFDATGAVVR